MSTALVLGGGGVAGIAWELGILDALFSRGVDLTTADRVIGTSAGSTVGAQIRSGESLISLCERQLVPLSESAELQVETSLDSLLEQFAACFEGGPEETELRRRLGEVALSAPTVPESARMDVIASRLQSHEWSEQELLITAVDAESGEFVVFGRQSDVLLVHAIAASCAVPGVWPPATIGGRRYMDGGMRSGTNADLAEGCDMIVIIAPFAGGFGSSVDAEAECLRAGGATVEVIMADELSTKAFGTNPLDPKTRAPSLLEGRRQGALEVERIAKVWS